MGSSGPWLKQERERRGIQLEDISQTTKIRLPYLLAIEQEQFDQLPGGIIGRGFVRAYIKCIGLSEEDADQIYSVAERTRELQNVPLIRQESFAKQCWDRAMRLPTWALAGVFMVLGFGFATLSQQLRQHYVSFLDTYVSEESSAPGKPAQSFPLTSPQGGVKQARSVEEPAGTRSSSMLSLTKPPLQLAQASSFGTSDAPGSATLNLLVKVRQDAWISIIADGHRVFSETLIAPSERLIEAHSHILVRAGNIGAVEFVFNGKSLPPQGAYDEARTLSFDANGLQTATRTTAKPAAVTPNVPSPIQ